MRRFQSMITILSGILLFGIPAWSAPEIPAAAPAVTTPAVTAPAQTANSTTYKIDADHTNVGFKIRHLFSNVSGNFTEFEGTVDYDPKNPSAWKTSAVIHAASINTNVAGRDKHLRSSDFFDVEKYPAIMFKSTGVENATETSTKLKGDLTIHGVTKPVMLDLQIHGVGKDPWGNTRAGFTATTKINRKDFGLTWNKTLETGGVLVGDDVDITLEVEAVQSK